MRAGGPNRSEFELFRIEIHVGARPVNPVAQPGRHLLAYVFPRVIGFRLRTHIPRMGPSEYRIDMLSSQ